MAAGILRRSLVLTLYHDLVFQLAFSLVSDGELSFGFFNDEMSVGGSRETQQNSSSSKQIQATVCSSSSSAHLESSSSPSLVQLENCSPSLLLQDNSAESQQDDGLMLLVGRPNEQNSPKPTKQTPHTQPNWLNILNQNFQGLIIGECSALTRRAVEGNEVVKVSFTIGVISFGKFVILNQISNLVF